MQITCRVVGDAPHEYTGKRGLVKEQRLALLDIDSTGKRLVNTFDYTMSESEKVLHAGKVLDKVLVLSVTDILPFGGRLRMRGEIVKVENK